MSIRKIVFFLDENNRKPVYAPEPVLYRIINIIIIIIIIVHSNNHGRRNQGVVYQNQVGKEESTANYFIFIKYK